MRQYIASITVKSAFPVRIIVALGVSLFVLAASMPSAAQFYEQTNLVSDVAGYAAFTDTNLVGAWGVTHLATSPWWVNSTMGHVSLLFNGAGQPLPVVVAVPPTNVSTPTGIASYAGDGFQVGSNLPSRFIFVTLNGTISGWNPNQADRTVAVLAVDNSATSSYTGVAIAQQNGQDLLYAANFGQGTIDVFDTNFNAVAFAAGAFADRRVPAGLTVFNVQLLGSDLYVTYAPTNVFSTFGGLGQGWVDAFDVNGMLERRLTYGFWMNAPWGVALAPANFGPFSNDILVGMFGNGAIVGFDAKHGHFRGFLKATDGLPLRIDKGLWGLGFGNGASAGPTNTLYFATDFSFAGAFHGLFGALTVAPGGDQDNDHDDQGK